MSLYDRVLAKKKKLEERIQRGRVVTEQMKAEKLRKKSEKIRYLEPGTIRYGLVHRQGVTDLMRDAYERRKSKRK
jgi:hypothetical protein